MVEQSIKCWYQNTERNECRGAKPRKCIAFECFDTVTEHAEAERVVEIVSQMNLTNNCFVLMNNDHWCVQIIVY